MLDPTSINPIWVPGNGSSGGSSGGNPLNQLFSFKGVALAGIAVYGLVELKGDK